MNITWWLQQAKITT